MLSSAPLWIFLSSLGHVIADEESTKLVCETSTFSAPVVPGAKVLSITAEEKLNVTTRTATPVLPPVSGLDYCEVKVYLTHPGADDKVLVETWLPISRDAWNGRFQATGGGAFATGMFDFTLGYPLKDGYAAASTDGGHPPDFLSADWVLNPDKSINWPLLQNFASRSIADEVHVGKSIAEQYYGKKPHHSYYSGCSQGGRHGFALAQKYPGLVDGIMASAPALKFAKTAMGAIWPQVVMSDENILISNCEMAWFDAKAVEECDLVDGAIDGIIGDPDACNFDPATFVGKKIQCGSYEVTITQKIASVVKRIREGPSTLFGENITPGYPYGLSENFLMNVTIDADGVRTSHPSAMLDVWPRTVLVKDPAFNASKLSYAEYLGLILQTSEQHGWLLDSYDTGLTAFRDAGGKFISWHGINDPNIPYKLSTGYWERLGLEFGGAKAVNEFFRLFLAPGVEHCGFGPGAAPKDPLAQLVDWVENGEIPETLQAETVDAEGELITRDLCLYPKTIKYMGLGDVKRASSWSCEGGEDEEETLENHGSFLGGFKDRIEQAALGLGLKVT
ncbi:feruloyl esterase B precursor [Aaosphaeria arxii CBS 175.79]|uniref:Carboxylic ester hydrolase n=1 Tax=Aaosphaeria arxii CBS 175.79 TaxID=1450172 RepID=A0A6A5X9V8_9PLEO|nr:feruloyl esterase B precursor [Aaosphaeria arxii CBS 175.79]KAF2009646.1 feruloyl esterase B precursor [Aaosphaeria arxii CBS 175.79]